MRVVSVLTAMAAGGAVWWMTARWGVGTSPDSVDYLNLARAFPRTPRTTTAQMFPPGYPALLALLGLSRVGLLEVARWLAVAVVVANVYLSWALARRLANEAAAAIVAVGFLLGPGVLSLQAYALSDGLALAFSLGALLASARPLATGPRLRRVWPLGASTALLAAACLTRFTAVAMVIAVLVAMRVSRRSLPQIALVATGSLGPATVWLLVATGDAGSVANRRLGFHPPSGTHIRQGLETVTSWVGSGREPGRFAALLGLLVGACLLGVARRGLARGTVEARRSAPLLLVVSLGSLGHLLLVLLSVTVLDHNVPLDQRILLPTYALVLPLIAGLWVRGLPARSSPGRILALTALLMILVFGGVRTLGQIQDAHERGSGYASAAWKDSRLLALTRGLPDKTLVYSNVPDFLELEGIDAHWVPRRTNPYSNAADPTFAGRRARLHRQLAVEPPWSSCSRALTGRSSSPPTMSSGWDAAG